ncbi:hypothetical protein QYE76_014266 [Lolium multiflorum]|uniref:Uncharacterized protein n=1 Tax=Lolium multiflorum TaxID=4521 RepID=A0AAD8U4F3_LOLMU|nr:hypothetical protein QYE76_014266 [Lolium multiflorum]
MSTKGCQAQAPAAGNRAPTAGSTPLPRRGQIKEKIIKDVVAAVASMAAGLVARADKNGPGGLPVAADADGK